MDPSAAGQEKAQTSPKQSWHLSQLYQLLRKVDQESTERKVKEMEEQGQAWCKSEGGQGAL